MRAEGLLEPEFVIRTRGEEPTGAESVSCVLRRQRGGPWMGT